MLLVNAKNKDQIRWRFNIKSMRVLSNKPESKKVTNEGALHRFFITYNARESPPNAKKEKKIGARRWGVVLVPSSVRC